MVKKRRIRSIKPLNCFFCQEKTLPDYKEPEVLRRFISPRGRILACAQTGVCSKHQRRLAKEIKRARHLSLLPFVAKV